MHGYMLPVFDPHTSVSSLKIFPEEVFDNSSITLLLMKSLELGDLTVFYYSLITECCEHNTLYSSNGYHEVHISELLIWAPC